MAAGSGRFPELLIIGAGITGLALAWRFRQLYPDASVSVIDKEPDVAMHASGRNSGVLHAGFYYSSDSLKARLCRQGNAQLQAFCREHELKLKVCGKLVVTRDASELPRLQRLYHQGLANGVEVQLIDEAEVRELEPNARTHGQALLSPNTASVDPIEICQFLKRELEAAGVRFFFETAYQGRRRRQILTSRGVFEPGRCVNAAGLYADKIARDFGFGLRYTLLPFKGLYLACEGDERMLTRHVYPVPDPRQPFLGVHYTRTVDDHLKLGPTALPAFWRENYSGFSNFALNELLEVLWYEGCLFLTNSFGFRQLALQEVRKVSRRYMAHQAAALTTRPPARLGGFLKPGIRAQLLEKSSLKLVQDFVIEGDAFSTHVLNAVSPAFTCGLAFADHLL
ncbi:MAG: L-2-hydroxyglutarate oxidase, partial [Candidatus Sericytochromatia bacterium]